MIVGKLDKRVTLAKAPLVSPQTESDEVDGYEELTPTLVWAQIEPLSPGGTDNRTIQHLVTMRYHPQVNVDTRIQFGTRYLYVRGVQNVNEDNVSMVLLCEEVQR